MVVRSVYRWMVMVFFLLLLTIPSLVALALGGSRISPVTYIPGTTITNHYIVYGTDYPVKVMVDGSVFRHITTTEIINNEFDLIISFPLGEYVPVGSHTLGLTVLEEPPSQQGISAQVTVSKNIEVIVYSYEKDIQVSLSAPNINEGSKVIFQLGVQSVGYPDIDEVSGEIIVYDDSGTTRGSITTDKKPLQSLSGLTFIVPFDTSTFSSGNYQAVATVWYDRKSRKTNTTFLIGNLDLILNNYTSMFQPGFNEFSVQVTSNWGNPLRNVYAKLFLNGTELVQTPSIDLEPWQQGALKALVKVDVPPGIYPGMVQLFFEGEQREIPATLTVEKIESEVITEVEKKVQESKSISLFPAVLTFAFLVFMLLIYLWRRKKGKILGAGVSPAEAF